MNSHYLEEARV